MIHPLRTRSFCSAAVVAFCAFSSVASVATAAPVFTEDFGDLANGTTITTDNTNFTYVRVGTGGGSITALNPSTLSTGASMVLAGPTSTSLNGVGVGTGLGLSDQAELSFLLEFADADAGDLVITMGEGNRFTGDSTFTTDQLLFGVQSNNGVLEYRTDSAWVEAGFTFADATAYDLVLAANGSNLQITINGTPLDLITDSANNQNADGFRIYAVSGAANYEIDNIAVVPEPAGIVLGGIGLVALAGIARGRRRTSK